MQNAKHANIRTKACKYMNKCTEIKRKRVCTTNKNIEIKKKMKKNMYNILKNNKMKQEIMAKEHNTCREGKCKNQD